MAHILIKAQCVLKCTNCNVISKHDLMIKSSNNLEGKYIKKNIQDKMSKHVIILIAIINHDIE